MKSINIANGVNFHTIKDDRFKTNRISIHFLQKIKREEVTINALIPELLKKGYEGCDNFTLFNRELEELYGASVGAYVTKKGDYHDLVLAITTLDDSFALENEKLSAKSAEILMKMAFNPIIEGDGFCKKDVEIEKNALIDVIEAELNEKRIYALNQMTRLMFEDSPSGLPSLGFKEDVPAITPKIAKDRYDEIIKNARVEIMFVGCGDETNAINVFKEAFKSLDRNYTELESIDGFDSTSDSIKEKTERMEVTQSKLVMGFSTGLKYNDEERYAMQLAIAILGGTPSSKLFLNVREKLQLCYYCAGRFDSIKGVVAIDSGVENDKVDTAKDAILNEIEELKKGNFTDEDISFALLSVKNSLSSIFESKRSIEVFFLNQIVLGLEGTPEKTKEKYDKVTKEEIIKAAQKIKLDTVYLLTGKEE